MEQTHQAERIEHVARGVVDAHDSSLGEASDLRTRHAAQHSAGEVDVGEANEAPPQQLAQASHHEKGGDQVGDNLQDTAAQDSDVKIAIQLRHHVL